jgi:hypothetical protein
MEKSAIELAPLCKSDFEEKPTLAGWEETVSPLLLAARAWLRCDEGNTSRGAFDYGGARTKISSSSDQGEGAT